MAKKFEILFLLITIGIVAISGCASSEYNTSDDYNLNDANISTPTNTTTSSPTQSSEVSNSESSDSNSDYSSSDSSSSSSSSSGYYVGSINSDVYHYPSCSHAKRIKSKNLITFNSVAEAKSAGYRPCKVCNPPG